MPVSVTKADTGNLGRSEKFDELVRQITKSDTFRSAPVMQNLLVYLWAQRGQSISEYAIATEALGRPATFDPKSESSARVQVARLRAKLKEFYEGPGAEFPLRITLPLGGHELQWTYQAPEKSFASQFSGVPKQYLWGAAIAGFFLVALCIGLLLQVRSLKASIPPAAAPLPGFWKSFLVPGKSTEIVIPSPMHFYWPSHQVAIRDFNVSDFDQWATSPFVKSTSEKWGPPEPSQPYVGAAEMTAGVNILQYLEREGQAVRLVESRRFPAESFGAQNTVFLGMPRTARYLESILAKTNYYMPNVDPNVVVKSRNPRPGEPAEYHDIVYAANRKLSPAIIMLLPQRPEGTRIMLLLGKHIMATAALMVGGDGMKSIDAELAKAGSPDAWEMVVQAEVYNDTILKCNPLVCRAIAADFWK